MMFSRKPMINKNKMLNLFMVSLFAIGCMECFMIEIISYTLRSGDEYDFVYADNGNEYPDQTFYVFNDYYEILTFENLTKNVSFSPFIIKQVNGQEIHQFVDIRDKGYHADKSLTTKIGKLFFTNNESYLQPHYYDDDLKTPKCFPGEVFISEAIGEKCHLLIQLDKIQEAENFTNPILIQSYSLKNSFEDDAYHQYIMVKFGSANYKTILKEFDLIYDYGHYDGFQTDLIPKNPKTIAIFNITNGEIKITIFDKAENDTGINRAENDTGTDKAENDTGIDRAENDTGIDRAENDTGLDKAQIAAIVVSCVVVVVVIVIVVIFLVTRNKAKSQSSASVNRNQYQVNSASNQVEKQNHVNEANNQNYGQIPLNEANNQVENQYQGNLYQENLYQATNSIFHVNQGQANEANDKTQPRYE